MTDTYNPWAGLASYEDPATAKHQLKFCGRDDESYDMARLIMGNVFVTLYGKSGIGKTSLLNAGVFPELRENQYSPVSLRLGIRDEEHPQSYQSMIIDAIGRIVNRIETINVIAEQQDQNATDYLWNYFARHRFYDKDGEPTTPVFVFDQFEEVFRGHRDEAETLLRQLDYINDKDHALDRCEVDGQTYRYEQNFRFVVSIREDDLYLLEDSIDNCYLPALKRCRYRLRSLSEDGARDAILIPGKGLFNPNEEDSIANAIISKSRNEDGSISTNIISLLCSRIYTDHKKSGADHISPAIVDNFLKGNPFERFYNEATKGFSDREKSYIEDNFVDSTGRRNSIPESDFLKHVPNGATLLEGDSRILQRTSTSSDGKHNRVELIHDSFCEPLSTQKEKRAKRKRMIQLGLACLIAIISTAAVFYVWNINHRMRITESRVIAEKASALVDQGDSYLARLLALEALPPNRPYTVEAESALRKASQYNNAILRGRSPNEFRCASFSPDSKYIVTVSFDNTVIIWDLKTGLQMKVLKVHNIGYASSVYFSPDGKYIAMSYGESLINLDINTGQQVEVTFGSNNYIEDLSPDGKYIVTNFRDTLKIWDAKTGQQMGDPLIGHTDYINSAKFSPDGKYIVTASDDGTVRIWDAKTGQQVREHLIHNTKVGTFATFSADGEYLMTTDDKTIQILDLKGKQPKEIENDVISFSPDGRYFMKAINDETAKIIDAKTYKTVGYTLMKNINKYRTTILSPDGKYIMQRNYDKILVSRTDMLNKQSGTFKSATLTNDGRYLIAYRDSTVYISDIKSLKLSRYSVKILQSTKLVGALVSPDGRYIVAAIQRDSASHYSVRIWDVKTGLQIGAPLTHTRYIVSANFSPDGKYIVTASGDTTARIWDVKTGLQIGAPLIGHTNVVNSANFSPDGKYIVTASDDGTVRIWDAKTQQEYRRMETSYDVSFLYASFSPDGKYIVSATSDVTVIIWDAKTGLQIVELSATASFLYKCQVAFVPDGNMIILASQNGFVSLWDFPPLQELIDSTRERFKDRPLTQEERRKYYLE